MARRPPKGEKVTLSKDDVAILDVDNESFDEVIEKAIAPEPPEPKEPATRIAVFSPSGDDPGELLQQGDGYLIAEGGYEKAEAEAQKLAAEGVYCETREW